MIIVYSECVYASVVSFSAVEVIFEIGQDSYRE